MKRALILLLAVGAACGAAAQAPSPYDSALEAARAAMAQQRYNEAHKEYSRAAKLPGADALVCEMGMANADGMQASFGRGQKECAAALRLAASPQQRSAVLALAGALDLKQAAAEQWRDAFSKHIPGLLAAADSNLRAALALTPNDALLHFDLATALLREGQLAQAGAQSQAYLQLAPLGPMSALARGYLTDPDLGLANRAPDFHAVLSDGTQLSLQTLAGKVVLLDFWGSWCPPCRESVATLQSIWHRFANQPGFVLLSVDSHESRAAGAGFAAAHKMTWPQYWDGDGQVQRAFGVHLYPTFILLDGHGVMRGRWAGEGMSTGAVLEYRIKDWLARAPAPAPSRNR